MDSFNPLSTITGPRHRNYLSSGARNNCAAPIEGALLGAKLGELYLSAEHLLFSRTLVGKKGAQRQKEGPPDCGPTVGLREEPSREEGAQEPNSAGIPGTTCRQHNRRAGRQAGKQTGKHTGRQAGRQSGRQACRQEGRQAGGQAGRQAEAAGRQEGRQADRQAGRQAGLQGRRAGRHASTQAPTNRQSNRISSGHQSWRGEQARATRRCVGDQKLRP